MNQNLQTIKCVQCVCKCLQTSISVCLEYSHRHIPSLVITLCHFPFVEVTIKAKGGGGGGWGVGRGLWCRTDRSGLSIPGCGETSGGGGGGGGVGIGGLWCTL